MNALVVPSNRPDQVAAFIEAWRLFGDWDRLYLMEDAEYPSSLMRAALAESPVPVVHLTHYDAEASLGDKAWLISKKDSACRSFGMYKAWKDGADYILTLDDDVRPIYRSILGRHIDAMNVTKFKSSVQGLWPRGMPSFSKTHGPARCDVKASMGLWQGVPDLYAEDMLNGYTTEYKPPLGSRIVPDGEFIPICGMNFCVHRDAMPLCWFPLMGEGQPYSRFDDIWMGLILKRGFDLLGWKLSVGEPHVRHIRASDPVKCAERERPGRAVNDDLWLRMGELTPGTLQMKWAVKDIALDILALYGNTGNEYWKTMAKGIREWASLFEDK